MVPAFFMGLKIDNFRSNLKKYFKINKNFLINSVSKISQIYSQKKFSSLVLLVYCPHLKEFIAWAQQLMAESLGKKNETLRVRDAGDIRHCRYPMLETSDAGNIPRWGYPPQRMQK